jgi:hypothetical protein
VLFETDTVFTREDAQKKLEDCLRNKSSKKHIKWGMSPSHRSKWENSPTYSKHFPSSLETGVLAMEDLDGSEHDSGEEFKFEQNGTQQFWLFYIFSQQTN